MLDKEKIENMKKFILELKNKIRDSGRTNVIPIRELDYLFIKYKINIRELGKENG